VADIFDPFPNVISFFATKKRTSKFSSPFLPLSTFFPARSPAAIVFTPFSGVLRFLCHENRRLQIFPLDSGRLSVF